MCLAALTHVLCEISIALVLNILSAQITLGLVSQYVMPTDMA